jgi:hypothetical protein
VLGGTGSAPHSHACPRPGAQLHAHPHNRSAGWDCALSGLSPQRGIGIICVTERKGISTKSHYVSKTFYPSGSNVYSVASGQRVLRFLISDGSKSYLDLNSVRLCFDITNTNTTGGKNLLLSGEHAACLFSRLTVRIAGIDVEDILYYNRYVGCCRISGASTAADRLGVTNADRSNMYANEVKNRYVLLAEVSVSL